MMGVFRFVSPSWYSTFQKSRESAEVETQCGQHRTALGRVFRVKKTGRWHFCWGWGNCKTTGDADDRDGAARQLLDDVIEKRFDAAQRAVRSYNAVADAAGEPRLSLMEAAAVTCE